MVQTRPDQWNACQKGRTLLFIGGYIQSHGRGELLHLTVYKLDQGGSMNAWANGGRWPISRRPAHLMINATVSCFQRPTSMHLRIFLGFITRPSSIKPTLMTLKIWPELWITHPSSQTSKRLAMRVWSCQKNPKFGQPSYAIEKIENSSLLIRMKAPSMMLKL